MNTEECAAQMLKFLGMLGSNPTRWRLEHARTP